LKSELHIIDQGTDERISMMNNDMWGHPLNDHKFTYSMAKVLKSMKLGEKSSTIVQYSWMKEKDMKAIEKYGIEQNERLKLDLNFKNMLKVEDFYHDGTVFKKVLKKGDGTASPYTDSTVHLQIKVAYKKHSDNDDEQVFVLTKEPLEYTLDEYTLPPLIRNILKSLKLKEVIEVHTVLKEECIPEFEDEAHGLFKKEWFDNVGELDEASGQINWIVFTLEMTDFYTPESMHALYMNEKIPRLLRIKDIAAKFFKAQNWPKA